MKALFVAVLAAFPQVLNAENLTGNQLLEICEDREDLAKRGFCLGYVSGVVEGMKWGVALPLMVAGQTADEVNQSSGLFLRFCNPEEATLSQLVDVSVLHLRASPADRHNSARIQIQEALAAAYPCPVQ